MKRKSLLIANVLIYILFSVAIILCISNKQNLHIDEVFSYGLANNMTGINPSFENGVVYEPAGIIFDDYMTVAKDSRFDYLNVWKNQADDVHPPLFYVILHTICSLFPETFSVWYAGVINILFSLVLVYFLRRIIELIVPGDLFFKTSVSLAFILSAGILSANTFLRMYVMAMALCTAFTYFVIKKHKNIEDKHLWVKFAILLVLGALTHYYCVIYDVFLCVCLGIYFIRNKQIIDTKKMVVSSVIAALVSIGIFPFMIKHLFMSSRGRQTIKNAITFSVGDYFKRVVEFFTIINDEIFGGMLFFLALALLVLIIVLFRRGEQEDIQRLLRNISIPLAATGAFFLIISKWAVFTQNRYMYIIYPEIFILIMAIVYIVISRMASNRIIKGIVWIAVLVFIVVGSWGKTYWSYMYWYPDEKSIDQLVEHSEEKEAVCIYNESWEVQYLYKDFENLKNVVFIQENELEDMQSLIDYGKVLFVSDYLQRGDVKNILDVRFTDIDKYLMQYSGRGYVYYLDI